eukprot:2565038-Pyramimonas_sp.AAC.1
MSREVRSKLPGAPCKLICPTTVASPKFRAAKGRRVIVSRDAYSQRSQRLVGPRIEPLRVSSE